MKRARPVGPHVVRCTAIRGTHYQQIGVTGQWRVVRGMFSWRVGNRREWRERPEGGADEAPPDGIGRHVVASPDGSHPADMGWPIRTVAPRL